MSITLMTAAWRIGGLSSTQKLVLLSLADNANDQGECYPSIAQISARTCLTDRAVRAATRSLEEAGFVRSVARSGTSTVYFLTLSTPEPGSAQPRNNVPTRGEQRSAPEGRSPRNVVPPTPERGSAPPRNVVPPTPERGSPKPSLNRQENRHLTVNRPEHVPESTWRDFLAIRKAKRAPLTETALRGIEREAGKAGLTLGEALSLCCERGWQGFDADWVGRSRPVAASPPKQSQRSAFIAELTGRKQEDYIDVVATQTRRIG